MLCSPLTCLNHAGYSVLMGAALHAALRTVCATVILLKSTVQLYIYCYKYIFYVRCFSSRLHEGQYTVLPVLFSLYCSVLTAHRTVCTSRYYTPLDRICLELYIVYNRGRSLSLLCINHLRSGGSQSWKKLTQNTTADHLMADNAIDFFVMYRHSLKI